MGKSVVLMFGRFNPPTTGHEKLLRFATTVAAKTRSDVALFVSNTQDQKNPLSWAEKTRYIHRAFPAVIFGPKDVKNPPLALTWAKEQGYNQITFLAGEDRLSSYLRLARSWTEWNKAHDPAFNVEVTVKHSPRDSNAVSATDARKYARQGKLKELQRVLMRGINDPITTREILNAIQHRLGKLNESMSSLRSFAEWVAIMEADDDVPEVKKKPEPRPEFDDAPPPPEDLEMEVDDTTDTPPEDTPPDEQDADMIGGEEPDKEEIPQPPAPLPIDATSDEGRVKSDNKDNQSMLVLYPKIRLKKDMVDRATQLRAMRAK